ncbi:DUF6214 family protein [Streptomyces sp. NPDC050095]|uniref:DUF6214 family protein n=1 Tax=unclassified Streptomyces TaxID=2593676 RepID=UPI00341C290F
MWDDVPRRDLLPPWFHVRLTFGDGTNVDVLAVVTDGRIAIEDVRSQPPLSLDDLASLADWIEGPLEDACRVVAERDVRAGRAVEAADSASRRARPSWPRGTEGRRVVAEAYVAAQREGRDPVLAVMCATGRSRRKSLRMIAAARDAGFLTPRHNRR